MNEHVGHEAATEPGAVPVPDERASEGCSAHRWHYPRPLTSEAHHVIPVAWQLFWQPPKAPFPGRDPNGRGLLWDARTVTLCPTGHRNVHALIVQMMRATKSDDPAVAYKAVNPKGADGRTAYLALIRFAEVGGKLTALAGAGLMGFSLPPPAPKLPAPR